MLLACGIDEVIVAANDVRDGHVMIVDHDREHVGRGSVRAQQHEVVEILVLPDHAALDLVVDHGFSGLGRLETDHRFDVGRSFGGRAVAPAAVVAHGAPLRLRGGSHLLKLLLAGIAIVGIAVGQQLFGDFTVTRGARELIDGLAIPIDAEPLQAVDNGADSGFRGALAVGILDPEQHLAATAPRVEPVKQGRSAASDMQESGRRGRKAGDDGLGHGVINRPFRRAFAGVYHNGRNPPREWWSIQRWPRLV